MKENSNSTRNIKHVNFVPKDVQKILLSHRSIMNRKCSTRRLFFKISQYSLENTFLIKMQVFRPLALLKRDSNTGVFCEHWEIFKSTYFEVHLRTAASESFTWTWTSTNNIGSEEDVFSKIKQNKNRSNTQLYEKTCLFMMFFIISLFSFSPLHVRRHLPYIIKDDTSESFETA